MIQQEEEARKQNPDNPDLPDFTHIQKARFDPYLVLYDGSYGLHNGPYSLTLLDAARDWVQLELNKPIIPSFHDNFQSRRIRKLLPAFSAATARRCAARRERACCWRRRCSSRSPSFHVAL